MIISKASGVHPTIVSFINGYPLSNSYPLVVFRSLLIRAKTCKWVAINKRSYGGVRPPPGRTPLALFMTMYLV